MCIQLFCNSHTMRGKCRILGFKIIVFRAMGLVGTEVSVRTYCLHLLTACEDRPRTLLQNIHYHVPDYTVS
jgi:hypothetical protein